MNSSLPGLIKTYLLISLRRLMREKAYALICVLSLAIGMASLITIGAYAYSELTYDRHNEHIDDIYLIYAEGLRAGLSAEFRKGANTPYNFGRTLLDEYPHIGQSVEFINTQATFRAGDMRKVWHDVFFVDPELFDIFSHSILHGDSTTAFAQPNSIAVSESFARFYFGRTDVVGETILHDDIPINITLVFADLAGRTVFPYSAVLPHSLAKSQLPTWRDDQLNLHMFRTTTFMRLNPDFPPDNFQAVIDQFLQSRREEYSSGSRLNFGLRKLAAMRIFSPDLRDGWVKQNTPQRFFSLIAIGLCIALIACINTVNMSAARLLKRSDEHSTQRWLGASRSLLGLQVLVETLLFSVVALAIALVIVELCARTTIAGIFNEAFTLLQWDEHAGLYLGLAGACLALGMTSGLYPLLKMLKQTSANCFHRYQSGQWLSRGLIAFQLFIATGAIAVTYLFIQQSHFLFTKDLGISLDDRVLITFNRGTDKHTIQRIAEELTSQDYVENAALSFWAPGTNRLRLSNQLPSQQGDSEPDPTRTYGVIFAGINAAETLDFRFVMGGPPRKSVSEESQQGIIVSESILPILGWENRSEADIIGQRIKLSNSDDGGKGLVVGVIKDFHSNSLYQPQGPVIIQPISMLDLPEEFLTSLLPHIVVHLSSNQPADVLAKLEAITSTHNPNYPFNYSYFDDLWREHYGDDTLALTQSQLFSIIALALCLLGLSGLAAYTAANRRKELCIRKVIGAPVLGLMKLLGRQYFVTTLLVAFPAWLAAFFIVDTWLQRFSYHIDITLWPFIAATLIVTMLSQITVCLQSWRVVNDNPVNSLRYE